MFNSLAENVQRQPGAAHGGGANDQDDFAVDLHKLQSSDRREVQSIFCAPASSNEMESGVPCDAYTNAKEGLETTLCVVA